MIKAPEYPQTLRFHTLILAQDTYAKVQAREKEGTSLQKKPARASKYSTAFP